MINTTSVLSNRFNDRVLEEYTGSLDTKYKWWSMMNWIIFSGGVSKLDVYKNKNEYNLQ